MQLIVGSLMLYISLNVQKLLEDVRFSTAYHTRVIDFILAGPPFDGAYCGLHIARYSFCHPRYVNICYSSSKRLWSASQTLLSTVGRWRCFRKIACRMLQRAKLSVWIPASLPRSPYFWLLIAKLSRTSFCLWHYPLSNGPSSHRWGIPVLTLGAYLRFWSIVCYCVTVWLIFFKKEVRHTNLRLILLLTSETRIRKLPQTLTWALRPYTRQYGPYAN